MNLCFICGEYPPWPHGGIGTVTQMIGKELVRLGHRVRVIGIRERGDAAPEEEVDAGVEILRLPQPRVRRLGWLRSRYLLYQQVATWARRGEIDLLEAPDYEGWTAAWPRLPIPVVVRLHGSVSYFSCETGRQISRLIFEVERMALQKAAFHCSTSRYTAERTRQLFRLRRFEPRILYNPVDLPEKDNSTQPPGRRVVFTGSLAIKKGVIPLVRAWGEVIRVLPNAQLHIYGRDGKSPAGGSMREYLQSQLPDSVLATIVFHGHVTSEILLEALRSAAVGVFPSFAEAFGLAPMECMAQGRPTIYSLRAGPGAELITDGENGLLIDPAKEAEIARAIIQVVSDADLATRLGAAGRRRIQESFSIEPIVRQNLAFYHDCVNHYS